MQPKKVTPPYNIEDLATSIDIATAVVATSENEVGLSIDLSDIGRDDGRVDVGVLLGNSEEPTDCLRPFENPVSVK